MNMKRKNFVRIIRLRSFWKIDRRRGNYKLPSGERLGDYIARLVESQMQLDNLGIRDNGDLCFCQGGHWNADIGKFNDYTLLPDFANNETCTYDGMEKRIKCLISEIVGEI